MAEDYTSLLGRSDQSWSDIASILLTEEKSKNKKSRRKQRRALIGGLLLSAWDSNKINNVVRNLKDADVDKQFDIAEATSNWEGYNNFVIEDKQYIAAGGKTGNYFETKAAINFNNTNPNFDELYKNQTGRHAIRTNKIKELAVAMQKNHETQKTTLGIDTSQSKPYLTKEKFLKPYEDFYRTKERRATDSSELSAVHSIFGVVGPARRRRKALDEKIIKEKNVIDALNIKYGGLLDPKNYGVAVPSYYDPDAIKYTQEDALAYVQREYGKDPILVKKLQDSIRLDVASKDDPNTAIKENEISETNLNALMIASTLDFDKITEQAIQLKDSFEDIWKTKYEKEDLPFTVNANGYRIFDTKDIKAKQEVEWYEKEESIYVQTELKLYSTESLELRQALINKEREEKMPTPNILLIRQYDKVIEEATTLAANEAAVGDYMDIISNPSAKAQFNSAWDVKDPVNNPNGTKTPEEGRRAYFTWWIDSLSAMKTLPIPAIK